MAQFMLLLYDDPTGWAKLSPEEMQKAVEKYFAWTKKPSMVLTLSFKDQCFRRAL